MIRRIDGSEIDFSWVKCSKSDITSTKQDLVSDLISSMRYAIKDDMIKFKKSHKKLRCKFCKNENESYENYHVDHDNPSFKTIKDNFLKITKLHKPTSFDDCNLSHIKIFKKQDKCFENEWVSYHNKHCNMQILCRDCNLRKKRT